MIELPVYLVPSPRRSAQAFLPLTAYGYIATESILRVVVVVGIAVGDVDDNDDVVVVVEEVVVGMIERDETATKGHDDAVRWSIHEHVR